MGYGNTARKHVQTYSTTHSGEKKSIYKHTKESFSIFAVLQIDNKPLKTHASWIQHHKHRKISDISSVAVNHTISFSLNRYLFSVSYGDRIERYGDVEFHLWCRLLSGCRAPKTFVVYSNFHCVLSAYELVLSLYFVSLQTIDVTVYQKNECNKKTKYTYCWLLQVCWLYKISTLRSTFFCL